MTLMRFAPQGGTTAFFSDVLGYNFRVRIVDGVLGIKPSTRKTVVKGEIGLGRMSAAVLHADVEMPEGLRVGPHLLVKSKYGWYDLHRAPVPAIGEPIPVDYIDVGITAAEVIMEAPFQPAVDEAPELEAKAA